MNLYMIGIGGKTPYSNIEVHDIQFLVGETIEDTHDELCNRWYGETVHLDSHQVINKIDGYELIISKEEVESPLKCFMVYVGGYQPNHLEEIHKVGLFVATTDKEARAKASNTLFGHNKNEHIDSIVEINSVIQKGYFIHLKASNGDFIQKPDWQGYKKLR